MSVYAMAGGARQRPAEAGSVLERNRVEDGRLLQRINEAAGRLHRLWSGEVPFEFEALQNRRANVIALQVEIDRLYAQRRQLVAERVHLMRGRSRPWEAERRAA